MSIVRHAIAPLGRADILGVSAHLASAVPLGILWLVVLVTGYATGLGLAATLVGLPILVGMAWLVGLMAELERRLAGVLLRLGIASDRRPRGTGPVARFGGWVADPAWWRELAYLAIRATAGVAVGVAVLVAVATAAALVAYPLYYRTGATIMVDEGRELDTLPWALLVGAAGLVCVPVLAWTVVGLGVVDRAVAGRLLGRVPGRPTVPTDVERAARRRAVVVHTALAAAIVLVSVGAWAATTPDGYFWPPWVLLAAVGTLGAHAVAALIPPGAGADRRRLRPLLVVGALAALVAVLAVGVCALTTPGGYFWPAWVVLGLLVPVGAVAIALLAPDTGRGRRGLVVHAATDGLIVLVAVLVWAGTTPGGYPWPAWVLLGLGVPLAAHALVLTTRRGDADALEERVEVLTSTRAAAVDAQAAELRRIERDLHDGAQARLTALAMDLGMARARLASAPESAGVLLDEAHAEAKRALVELRDLARGIHPAVLGDRGLDAAISALAGGTSPTIDVVVDTGGRLPAAVEGAAYFVVAECLANARKHSRADTVRVRVARSSGTLGIEVHDDGVGGADLRGGGLDGLRRRVEALDGSLSVVSAPSPGTTVRAEVPCGS